MRLIFVCLTLSLMAIGVEAVDKGVCKVCQGAIEKLQGVSPNINPEQANQMIALVSGMCETGEINNLGLGELCKEAVINIITPILKKAGQDKHYDKDADCKTVQFC